MIYWWLDQWIKRPCDLIAGWVAFWWAVVLIPYPEPFASVHIHMDSVLPLPFFGVFALAVFVSYWLAGTFSWMVGGRWKRRNAHLLAAAFYSFVTALFMTSGASITGQGTYLVLAVATGANALVPRHG